MDLLARTDTLITCNIHACNSHIVMFNCMAIIILFTMAIFVLQNSCFDHDDCDYNMLNCLLHCEACILISIGMASPFVKPIHLGKHNKVTCGCISSACIVSKVHEKYNPFVLIHLTCLHTDYLVININPVLKILKTIFFCSFLTKTNCKNIKNHGFNGLPLITEVFNDIFLSDLVSVMSTKSCARILKNTCFSSIQHTLKTALKIDIFDSVISKFFKKQVIHLLYFQTSTKRSLFSASLCHFLSFQKTMHFFMTVCQGGDHDHDKVDLVKIHVLISCINTH